MPALPTEVLQLLSRLNNWTVLQTYLNGLQIEVYIPGTTTRKIYTDGTDLFWNGAQLTTGGGVVTTPHNILSTTHPDTLVASVLRGSVIVGNATPAWSRLTVGAANTVLGSDGTDTSFRTLLAAGIAAAVRLLTAGAGLTGGGDLTADRTFDVGAGSGIQVNANDVQLVVPVTAVLGGTGQILYAVGDILQADTTTTLTKLAAVATGNVLLSGGVSTIAAWGKVGLATHVSGNLPVANLNSGTSAGATTFWRGDGVWAVPAGTGTGTVTSVALALPAIFTVTGSPVTGAGTLTGTLATQLANLVWAGPNTGAAAAPTFRALVTADFPVTGVAAGTYTKVTVDTSGRVTAALTDIDLATDVAATVLPTANGGTGLSAAVDDRVPVGNGTTWVSTALVNCATREALTYDTALNTFGKISDVAQDTFVTITGDGAVTIQSSTVYLTKGSAAAITVAAPGASGIGKRITITSGSDFAHVVTFTGTTLYDGTAGANSTWTAAALQGSSITFVGVTATKWNVECFNLGTIAP